MSETVAAEGWVDACGANDILRDDMKPFDHGRLTLALYRTADDRYYATDGICTHEAADLTDGFLIDNVIECPRHNGRFDIRTGEALGAPACVNLVTYPVKVENGRVWVKVGVA